MRTKCVCVLITLSLSMICLGQDATALRNELLILKQLVGKTWIAESKDPTGQMTLHNLLKFEPIHNGKVLRIYMECPELKFQSDGFYYYDPDKKEIAFLNLGSNGNFSAGNVKVEEGKILHYGYVTFSDYKLEFRNTYEITREGQLLDKWFSFEDKEWKAGHSRVFIVKQ